jgi:2-dehydro-3-deoxygluconokinase
MAADEMLDVVTIGEALVRFTPPGTLRLEQAATWEITPGGAEANAAVSLAHLGLSVGWISKFPVHPLARLVVGELNRHGVDTSRVVWTPDGRVGVCYGERATPPRPARVWYDRQHSAATTLMDAEVDWAYLTGARLALITGVTPALCPRLRDLTLRVAREMRAAGRLLALDVNYRAELWSPAEAATCLGEIIPLTDLVLCGLPDAERVFGLRGEPAAVAEALRSRYGVRTAVITLEGEGSLAVIWGARWPRSPARSWATSPS